MPVISSGYQPDGDHGDQDELRSSLVWSTRKRVNRVFVKIFNEKFSDGSGM